jgi:hypothetical protein
MADGTFNVARGVFDHPVFAPEPFTEREAWLWLIAEAQWKPVRKRVGRVIIPLQRGQLAHAVRFMAQRWCWPRMRVHRFLQDEIPAETPPLSNGLFSWEGARRMAMPEWLTSLKETASRWSGHKDARLGAALAYHSIFSVGPRIVIAVAIAGFVFGAEAGQGKVIEVLRGLLGDMRVVGCGRPC